MDAAVVWDVDMACAKTVVLFPLREEIEEIRTKSERSWDKNRSIERTAKINNAAAVFPALLLQLFVDIISCEKSLLMFKISATYFSLFVLKKSN
jgi:hypothetical protein